MKLLGFTAAVVLTFLTAKAWAVPLSFFDEISRLEHKKAEGDLEAGSRQRLAELYFLTSRCPDLLKLFDADQKASCTLCCACGEGCSAQTTNATVAKLAQFRTLLANSATQWNSKPVQVLWANLKMRPEAKYMALRFLRSKGKALSKPDLALQQSLQQELGLLELGER